MNKKLTSIFAQVLMVPLMFCAVAAEDLNVDKCASHADQEQKVACLVDVFRKIPESIPEGALELARVTQEFLYGRSFEIRKSGTSVYGLNVDAFSKDDLMKVAKELEYPYLCYEDEGRQAIEGLYNIMWPGSTNPPKALGVMVDLKDNPDQNRAYVFYRSPCINT